MSESTEKEQPKFVIHIDGFFKSAKERTEELERVKAREEKALEEAIKKDLSS